MTEHGLIRITLLVALVPLGTLPGGAAPPGRHLYFARNDGQAGPGVRYLAKTAQFTAEFKEDRVLLWFPRVCVEMRPVNANPRVAVEAGGRVPGIVNSLRGNNPEDWITGVPLFERLLYRNLYAGVDLAFGSSGARLKWEFHIAPHADVSRIRMEYKGAQGIEINQDGSLDIRTEGGKFREDAPHIYQESGGTRRDVKGGFRVFPGHGVGFEIGEYDHSRSLIIDPLISFSSHFGGRGVDVATAVGTDATGNVYVAGWTDSSDFGERGAGRGGGVEVFIAKWNAALDTLIYCTYIGGSGDDRALGLAVDAGNVFLTGWTQSPDFPTLHALQASLRGSRDAFVVELNASGNMVFGTYLGGTGYDSGNAIALDGSGNIYIAGDTTSGDFGTANAFQNANRGATDAFVVKLAAGSGWLVYGTYFGGSRDDQAKSIAVDMAGNAYITGETSSTDLPVRNALRSGNAGGQDAFVAKLGVGGNTLVYATYLGGSAGGVGLPEGGYGIAVDAFGRACVAGVTASTDFPVWNPLQRTLRGALDAFLVKLNTAGNGFVFSTYLGGSSIDAATAVAVDADGDCYVAGYTASADFKTADPVQARHGGAYDGFVARFSGETGQLKDSTFLGGWESDAVNAIKVRAPGVVYAAGQTLSGDFPLKGTRDASICGMIDAFLVKLVPLPVYQGFHDQTSCSSADGWAWNKSQPGASVDIEIWDGAALLAVVKADRLRGDLAAAGVGDGYHSFSYTIPDKLKDGKPHTLHARIQGLTTDLPGGPQTFSCTAGEGWLDRITCDSIDGWAWDRLQPNAPVNVEILDGATVLATVSANHFRGDLQAAGIGNGYHGFTYEFGPRLRDGMPRSLRLRIAQSNASVANPFPPLTCGPPQGFLDRATCDSVDGWVWYRNEPDSTVVVEILDAALPLIAVPANLLRSDLLAAGIGTGKYGFQYSFGQALRDGKAHAIRVRASNWIVELPGGPQTVQCPAAR